MFKLLSCIVAGAVALAPMLPAQAGFVIRSGFGFGGSIGPRSSFGFSVGAPYGGYGYGGYPYGGYGYGGYPYGGYGRYPYGYGYGRPYYGRVYPRQSIYPGRVIVPRQNVIVQPAYVTPYCGSTIYGSPIASPIPVDPYTGLACR